MSMKFKDNLSNLYNIYCDKINLHSKNFSNKNLKKSIELIRKVKKKKSKIILFGNGGSSSIANHVAIDFCKVANIKAIILIRYSRESHGSHYLGVQIIIHRNFECVGCRVR